MSDDVLSKLVPTPQALVRGVGTYVMRRSLELHIGGLASADVCCLDLLRETLPAGVDLELCMHGPSEHSHEAYTLCISSKVIEIKASGPAGAAYGVMTLVQLLEIQRQRGCGDKLPCLDIEDCPDFKHRGVLLDISRDRVPTMARLRALIPRLARWKINQLQLYTEHTFAYEGHEAVWAGSSPLTASEIQELDALCAAHHVALVPNQNSFGHMHRWLQHEPYRALANCPDGIVHPFAREPEPFNLCPTDPGSLALLDDLYTQLLPHFRSRLFNVGLDETIKLDEGRVAGQVAERGVGPVYLEFLRAVHGLVREHDRRMLFWGDIIVRHPQLISELPQDAIALEWGYEADHPFIEHTALFAEAGLEFWVCPGTSAWNALAPRTSNALANLSLAARAGHAAGAQGYLITDWGDFGHLQPPISSSLGYVVGAACAWNATSEPDSEHAASWLDTHVFEGLEVGAILCALGDVHRLTGASPKNGTALFLMLMFPERPLSHARLKGLTPAGLDAALREIHRLIALLDAQTTIHDSVSLGLRELRWVADMLALACELGRARLDAGVDTPIKALPERRREVLGNELQRLLGEHRTLWDDSSRPGGSEASRMWLRPLVRALSA